MGPETAIERTLARLGRIASVLVLAVWLIGAVSRVVYQDGAGAPGASVHSTGTVDSILAEHFEPVTHPPPAYPYDATNAPENERPILEFLSRAPIEAQVRMDVALHDLAINSDSFGAQGSAFLRKNSELKIRVLKLLKSRSIAPTELAAVIGGLRDCERIHRMYLSLPPSAKTGSYAWQNAWMSAYEEWIQALKSKPVAAPPGSP